MKYRPTRLTARQRLERDRRIADTLAAHTLGDTQGGTATGSRCPCSCGEQNWIDGLRSWAAAKARAHVAAEIGKALDAE